MSKKISVLMFLLLFCCGLALPVFSQDLDNAKMHYELGRMYYDLGLYEEAEAEFKRALQVSETLTQSAPPAPNAVVSSSEAISLKEPQALRSGYIVDEGDKLFIRVWENEDLTQEVIVRPDGNISFPLIDEVMAKGLTISELDKAMTDKLKEYIRFPDVSISLLSIGGSKIIVLGEVREPGVYTISGHKTVLEAIAMAEGFTADAVVSSVVLVQGGLENPNAKRLDLNKALHNPQTKENLVLKTNDIVFVPKKFIADVNYVIRQIIQPFSSGAREVRSFGQ